MECTQVLLGDIFEDVDAERSLGRYKVGALKINGVMHDIYNGENVIGRDDLADICISSKAVSLRHAVIEVENRDSHFLYDCGSTNKTRIGKIMCKPNVRYNLLGGEDIMFSDVKATYSQLDQPQIPQPTDDNTGSEAGSESMLNVDSMDLQAELNDDKNDLEVNCEEKQTSIGIMEESNNGNNNGIINIQNRLNDSSVFIGGKDSLSSDRSAQVVDASIDDEATDEEEDFVQPSQTPQEYKHNKKDTYVQVPKVPDTILTEDIFHVDSTENISSRQSLKKNQSTDIFEMETQDDTVFNKEVNYGGRKVSVEENSQFIFNVEIPNRSAGTRCQQPLQDPTFEAETQVEGGDLLSTEKTPAGQTVDKSNIQPGLNVSNCLKLGGLEETGTISTSLERWNNGCGGRSEGNRTTYEHHILCDVPTQSATVDGYKRTQNKSDKDKYNCDFESMLTTSIINRCDGARVNSLNNDPINKSINNQLESNEKKSTLDTDSSYGLFELDCDEQMSDLLLSNSSLTEKNANSKSCDQLADSNLLFTQPNDSVLSGLKKRISQQNTGLLQNHSNPGNIASDQKSNLNKSSTQNAVHVNFSLPNTSKHIKPVCSTKKDIIENTLDEQEMYNDDLTQVNEFVSKKLDKIDVVSSTMRFDEMNNCDIDGTQPNPNIPHEYESFMNEAETQPLIKPLKSCDSKEIINYRENNKKFSSVTKPQQNVIQEDGCDNANSEDTSISFDEGNIEHAVKCKDRKLRKSDKENNQMDKRENLVDEYDTETQPYHLIEKSDLTRDSGLERDIEINHEISHKDSNILLEQDECNMDIIEADTQPYIPCVSDKQDEITQIHNLVDTKGKHSTWVRHQDIVTNNSCSTSMSGSVKNDLSTVEESLIKSVDGSTNLSSKDSMSYSAKHNNKDILDVTQMDTQSYIEYGKQDEIVTIKSKNIVNKKVNPLSITQKQTIGSDSLGSSGVKSSSSSIVCGISYKGQPVAKFPIVKNGNEAHYFNDTINLDNQIEKEVPNGNQDETHNHGGEVNQDSTVKLADMEICSTVGTGIQMTILHNSEHSKKTSENIKGNDLNLSQAMLLNGPCSSSTPLNVLSRKITDSRSFLLRKKTPQKHIDENFQNSPHFPSSEDLLVVADKTPKKLINTLNKKNPITSSDERTLVFGRIPRKKRLTRKMKDLLNIDEVTSNVSDNLAISSDTDSKIERVELCREDKEKNRSKILNKGITVKAMELNKVRENCSKKPNLESYLPKNQPVLHLNSDYTNKKILKQNTLDNEAMHIVGKETSVSCVEVKGRLVEDCSLTIKSENLKRSCVYISKSQQDICNSNSDNNPPLKIQKTNHKEMINLSEKEDLIQTGQLRKSKRVQNKPSESKSAKKNNNELKTTNGDQKVPMQSEHDNVQEKDSDEKYTRTRKNKPVKVEHVDDHNDIEMKSINKIRKTRNIDYGENEEEPGRKSRRTTKKLTEVKVIDVINIKNEESNTNTREKLKVAHKNAECKNKTKLNAKKSDDLIEVEHSFIKKDGQQKNILQSKASAHEKKSVPGCHKESKRVTRKKAQVLDCDAFLQPSSSVDIHHKSHQILDEEDSSLTTDSTVAESSVLSQKKLSKFGNLKSKRIKQTDKSKNDLLTNQSENTSPSCERIRSSSSNSNLSISSQSGSTSSITSLISGSSKSNTPRRGVKRKEKVLFTGLSNPALESDITKLGGEVVDCTTSCTVLVTDKVRRTVKFLCALGQGKPIVTPVWISISRQCLHFEDPMKHLLSDPESEKRFNFKLSETIQKAKNQLLLTGYTVHATPSVKPPPTDIQDI